VQRDDFHVHFRASVAALDAWQDSWGAWTCDDTLAVPVEQVDGVLQRLNERLRDNFPYFHPRYAGQMLKPPHPVAVLAYATAMQINPNNHALDGGAATSEMEKEVVADLARMFGYSSHLGHLTASGTIANLEALWIARSLHPGKAIAASDQAHYTHSRMSEVIGTPFQAIATDRCGRMDLDALTSALRSGDIGTVVATAGTTGLGAVDPIHEIIPLAQRYGARVHVDAAYGGFFTLLAQRERPLVDPAPFLAIAEADSIVVDPHKHGLQPYGCGSVLFRDPSIGMLYKHDSPYTYFTSSELHLGEISLECSRAGASAAALWATLECLPLEPDAGLGPILAKSREAALSWAGLIDASDRLRLIGNPDLDIIAFYPLPATTSRPTASEISALSDQLFRATMEDPDDPVFLAKYVVQQDTVNDRDPSIEWDTPSMTVLRSVLMKPEHLAAVPMLHLAVERHVGSGALSR
jgi:glutamate/tyrosine decarboxylase-like PLP-dependent enzyme